MMYSKDDLDNAEIGDTFQDEEGGTWLKLDVNRCIRVFEDFDELQEHRSSKEKEVVH